MKAVQSMDGGCRLLASCGAEFGSAAQMGIGPRLYRPGLMTALVRSKPACQRSRVPVRSCDQVCPTPTSPGHWSVALQPFHLACYYH